MEYYGDTRFTTDIDPFFPDKNKDSEIAVYEFVSDESITTNEWILDGGLPDLSSILEIQSDGQDWVLLYGSNSEQSKKLDRNFYCAVDVAFIYEQSEAKIREYVAQKKSIDWPEIFSSSGVYSGELYCESFNEINDISEVRFEIGHEVQQYEQPEVRINNEVYLEGGTVERKVPIFDSSSIFPATIRYYWENPGSSNESTNRLALSPWVVKDLELSFSPTEFIYSDKNGDVAVLSVSARGDEFDNYRDLIYLRKDLFVRLGKRLGMIPIRHIVGEKRCANPENLRGEDSYRRFEDVG